MIEADGGLEWHRRASVQQLRRDRRSRSTYLPRKVVVRWGLAASDPRAEGHRFLRRVVGSVAECNPVEVEIHQRCDDCGGDHGRPRVTIGGHAGPHVSLARSDGLIAVAVADREIGIDIERLVPMAASVADVVFSATESLALHGLDQEAVEELVMRTWVRKEAVLKATGVGLRVDPADLVIGTSPLRLAGWAGPRRRPRLALVDVDTAPGYVAALACRTRRRLLVDACSQPSTGG